MKTWWMSSLCSHVYWISQYLCQGCVRISSNQEVCCFFIFSYIYFTTKLVLVFRTFLIYFCCFDFWCVIYPTAIARNFADFPVRIDGFSNISKNYVSSGQHFDHSYILPGVMLDTIKKALSVHRFWRIMVYKQSNE